jgi:F-type H+-transporting ATPase subunit a
MPHGMSWFNFLPFYENMEKAAAVFGMNGRTWYAHEHIGVQHIFGAFFVFLLLTVMAVVAYRKVANASEAIVPDAQLTTRTFVEIMVGTIYAMMSDIMGPKAAKFFLPLIGTCAFFILVSNAMGLVPGFLPPTDKLNTTIVLGVIIFLVTHIYGVKEHGIAYFKHFFGPIIKWYALPLMLLMLVIELISHFVRPLSLAMRLMANIVADHAVVAVFFAMVPFLVPVPMMLLGVMVVVVQTLVFCLLSTVYISMAIAHEEH